MASTRKSILYAVPSQAIVRSHVEPNQELAEAFERYLIVRGFSERTNRAYMDSVTRYVSSLGAADAVTANRTDIRKFQNGLLKRGLCANSIQLHTAALRFFYKFLRHSDLTKSDPTLLLSYRKLPFRMQPVPTLAQVEKMIAAASTPVESAVVETLYATGVRVSELVNIRLENIDFVNRVIRVNKGKGGKDRVVLFEAPAATAIDRYLGKRTIGFLFEAPARTGQFFKHWRSWYARFYDDQFQRQIRLGKVRDLSEAEARAKFERLKAETPGFHAVPPRPYTREAIDGILRRLAFRAGVGRIHPHALRRAFASHMLQDGADFRVIQELLGHESISSTMRYTNLSAANLKDIHDRYHPHGDGKDEISTNRAIKGVLHGGA
jgi:site-specific recombinase XerD